MNMILTRGYWLSLLLLGFAVVTHLGLNDDIAEPIADAAFFTLLVVLLVEIAGFCRRPH